MNAETAPKSDKQNENRKSRSTGSSNDNPHLQSKRQRIASKTNNFVSQRSKTSVETSLRSERSISSTSRASFRKAKGNYYRNRSRSRLGIASSGSSVGSIRSRSGNRNTRTIPQAAPSTPHVLCAIGENLARETCVVSLDLSAPFLLTVTKQSNGQSYSETIACLSVLKPNEVLLNEGRYHSPLAKKILAYFDVQRLQQQQQQDNEKRSRDESQTTESTNAIANATKNNSRTDEQTVVKFISRACFDQTKGAELLRKLARQDTYDSTLLDEYILLSSSHAVLHYAQVTLGAVAFARHSLDVRVHTGGHNHNKMEIDRSTILQLELLTNNSNKASARKESLIATMDCTKTGVGHRLLRTTLMAPPCRYAANDTTRFD